MRTFWRIVDGRHRVYNAAPDTNYSSVHLISYDVATAAAKRLSCVTRSLFNEIGFVMYMSLELYGDNAAGGVMTSSATHGNFRSALLALRCLPVRRRI